MKKIIIFNVFSLIFFLIILEILFRVLPTSDSEKTRPVNSGSPYLHLIENSSLLISSGAFFTHKEIKRTNNYGYFSDYNYEAQGATSKLITIGSSLVTANQISNEASFHGLINSNFSDEKRVYMLAGANAPQSQYLAYARFAMREFNPAGFFIVIGNLDFNSSVLGNALPNSGYHYFESYDAASNLILLDYAPSMIKEFFRNFALARYIFLNARVQTIKFSTFLGSAVKDTSVSGLDTSDFVLIDKFLGELKSIVNDVPVVLVIDSPNQRNRAVRHDISVNSAAHKNYILKAAHDYKFGIIDLEDEFVNDFKVNGKRFEWDDDSHWNAQGHRVVASAIMRSDLYKNYISK